MIMKNLAFDPATVTIKAGQSVTWTNQDSMKHTVVGDNGEFESTELANGGHLHLHVRQSRDLRLSLQHSPFDEGDSGR